MQQFLTGLQHQLLELPLKGVQLWLRFLPEWVVLSGILGGHCCATGLWDTILSGKESIIMVYLRLLTDLCYCFTQKSLPKLTNLQGNGKWWWTANSDAVNWCCSVLIYLIFGCQQTTCLQALIKILLTNRQFTSRNYTSMSNDQSNGNGQILS